MRTLQVLESAYRATVEEQDDPVVWITQAMQAAGGDFTVLLRGNAVSYAVRGQDGAGLRLGSWAQRHPADVAAALEALHEKGVGILAVEEDLEERGIVENRLTFVHAVPRASLAALYDAHERIWHW